MQMKHYSNITAPLWGKPPVTGGFTTQRACNTVRDSVWLCRYIMYPSLDLVIPPPSVAQWLSLYSKFKAKKQLSQVTANTNSRYNTLEGRPLIRDRLKSRNSGISRVNRRQHITWQLWRNACVIVTSQLRDSGDDRANWRSGGYFSDLVLAEVAPKCNQFPTLLGLWRFYGKHLRTIIVEWIATDTPVMAVPALPEPKGFEASFNRLRSIFLKKFRW